MDNKEIVHLYQEGSSVVELAKKYNTYTNKISRILHQEGVIMRTRAEAQSLAMKTGRASSPTKGKKRTQAEKEKIGAAISQKWDELPDEVKSQKSQQAKDRWHSQSKADREKFSHKSAQAVRRSAIEGSKNERATFLALHDAGFKVELHRHGIIPNQKMEVDLFLPEYGIAIEIDGPTHFNPIWGETELAKRINSDAVKNGLLINNGYNVIRVKALGKISTLTYQIQLSIMVVNTVRSIINGDITTKLVEIEVI